ncbi:hypothetical protein BT69DRAFT_1276671 [Atractiella rhizophila]|nr:hypothetical protein BT69DRAFT_1276671 [Atractiella rhizophila]
MDESQEEYVEEYDAENDIEDSHLPAHPSPNHPGQPGGSKKRKEAPSTVNEEHDDHRKKKRIRAQLSCAECKRRKIKCDRKFPCASCLKRGIGDSCHWEKGSGAVAQPFALRQDHMISQIRLARLEDLFAKLPRSILDSLPDPYHRTSSDIKSRLFPLLTSADPPSLDGRADDAEPRGMPDSLFTVNTAQGEYNLDVEDLIRLPPSKSGNNSVSTVTSGALRLPLTTTSNGSATKDQCRVEGSTSHLRILRASLRISFLLLPLAQTAPSSSILLVIGYCESCGKIYQSKEACDWCVQEFFEKLHWYIKGVHRATFMQEYQTFWNVIHTGGPGSAGSGQELEVLRSIDPLWLAVFSMVLCIPLDAALLSGKTPKAFEHYAQGYTKLMPKFLFGMSKKCLRLGDWTGLPRIRTIQVPYLQKGGGLKKFEVWMAAGIRIAQLLGLHDLGDDPRKMPPPDLAIPKGVNSLAREIGKLCWIGLVTYDYMQIDPVAQYVVDPSLANTDIQMNVDEDDLSSTGLNASKPAYVFTDATLGRYRYQMAIHLQKMFYAVKHNTELNYDRMLEFDKGFKEIRDSLPECLINANVELEKKRPVLMWTRNIIAQCCLQRGYPLHHYSTEVPARIILDAQQQLRESPVEYLWWTQRIYLSALMVLFEDLFHKIDTGAQRGDIETDLRYVLDTLPITTSTSLQPSVTLIRRSIALAQCLEQVARARMANATSDRRPFSEILKSIAATIQQEDEQPSPQSRAPDAIQPFTSTASSNFPSSDTSANMTPSATLMNPLTNEEFLSMLGLNLSMPNSTSLGPGSWSTQALLNGGSLEGSTGAGESWSSLFDWQAPERGASGSF